MPSLAPRIPQAFIDAGDLPWPRLEAVLRRGMGLLNGVEVLEVASGDPETLETLPGWCVDEGHTLIHTPARRRVHLLLDWEEWGKLLALSL